MGLAICCRIVERHHGRSSTCCTLGQGATLLVTLPAGQRDEESSLNDERTSIAIQMPDGTPDDCLMTKIAGDEGIPPSYDPPAISYIAKSVAFVAVLKVILLLVMQGLAIIEPPREFEGGADG
jgi:hypothetical protein